MSKSLGNGIALADDAATVRKKVMGMYTDPNRIRADVPGTVEGNPVFAWLDVFARDRSAVDDFKARYRAGTVGDVEVKAYLADVVNDLLEPMHERRARYDQPGLVEQLIVEGTERVRVETRETLTAMKQAMGISETWNRLRRRAERASQSISDPLP
jgi:tryptophanyl-tRNA synthetase